MSADNHFCDWPDCTKIVVNLLDSNRCAHCKAKFCDEHLDQVEQRDDIRCDEHHPEDHWSGMSEARVMRAVKFAQEHLPRVPGGYLGVEGHGRGQILTIGGMYGHPFNILYLNDPAQQWPQVQPMITHATEFAAVLLHVAQERDELRKRLKIDPEGDASIDRIYDGIDELLLRGNFINVDLILKSLDLDKHTNLELLAYATITLPARKKLTEREQYMKRLREKLRDRNVSQKEIDEMLEGLDPC